MREGKDYTYINKQSIKQSIKREITLIFEK